MSSFSASVILEGQPRPSPSLIRLHAGPLTLLLDPTSGSIRRIQLGDTVVLNGVYAAVRDENWDTVRPEIRELRIEQEPDSFFASFKATCVNEDVHFIWEGQITGDREGRITYHFAGEPMTEFRRNRIGLCVLHDACAAGDICLVEHVDGTVTEGRFPEFISPHQPFKSIRSITHHLPHQITSRVTLIGDVFEMEDQRNWTDASYKTYSTPIELPRPVDLLPGDRVEQQMTLEILNPGQSLGQSAAAEPIALRIEENPALMLPRIGFSMPTHDVPENDQEINRLAALQPDHLRCDLRLFDSDWQSKLEKAVDLATQLKVRLHLALFVDDRGTEQLRSFAATATQTPIDALLLFHRDGGTTPLQWQTEAREIASQFGAKLFAGTNGYFTEVNRNRLDAPSFDGLCWSLNPQVHAIDNLTLVESLDIQWQTANSAAQFTAGDLMISPITLKPRCNPYATTAPPPVPIDQLPPDVDPRQMSLFGAAWTLGSIASLSQSERLRSITYYETTGWRGLMETSAGPILAHQFVSRPGMVFPLYFVFALISGRQLVHRVTTTHPLDVTALLCSTNAGDSEARLLVASFVQREIEIPIPPRFKANRQWVLNQSNAVNACRQPEEFLTHGWEAFSGNTVKIGPFGLVALDGHLR